MKAYIKRHLITQTSLDSGALTMLGSVVHSFSEPGEYLVTILRHNEAVGRFQLTVEKECPAMQVDIDLATLHRLALRHPEGEVRKRFEVNPKGYAVFSVTRGAGGYALVASRMGRERKSEPFDSRELKEGDLFAATLIRPGTYSVTNVNTGAKGQIVVAYPKIGKRPYRPPDPVPIECTEKALEPENIEIKATQGQVYRFKTPSRIKIELLKPDDGPEGARQARIVGWRKPLTRLKGEADSAKSRTGR